MLTLSFILVNYNVKEFLNTCINSIEKSAANIPHEIIVVDNASEDGSVEFLKEKFPSVKVISNNKNIGFGKANNQAMSIARGGYFVIINPDTLVREDTFGKMLQFFERHPEAGIAGCKVLNPDGTLQLACRRSFPGPWVSFTRVSGLSRLFPKSKLFAKYNLTYLDENKTYEVDAISGAFMMMRRSVYEEIGGFDPVFFMYGEDLDLCYRVQSSGKKVYYVHETEIIHFKGESTKRSSLDETKVFYEAMHLFVKKHLSSSFLVELILRTAIKLRSFAAFLSAEKLILTGLLVDSILFIAAILFAESVYRPGGWTGFPEEVKPYVYFLPALFQAVISAFAGAYNKKSLSNLRIIIALLIGFFLLSSFTFFFKQFAFSRVILLIIYSVGFVSFSLWRVIFKIIFRDKINEYSRRNRALVVGTSEKSLSLAKKLKGSVTDIQRVIGLLGFSAGEIGKKIEGFEILGTIDTLKKVVEKYGIHKVIFLSDEISFTEMFATVSKFNEGDIDFVIAGSDQDFIVGKSAITMLDDIPLLKLHYNISDNVHKITKRTLDLILSISILIFIYPFVYFAALFKKEKSDLVKFILNVPKVFKGDKSFVGPEKDSHFDDLFLGKTGLTGFWYTDSFDRLDETEINKLNIFYARNQNIWLDFEILGKTFSRFFIKQEL